MRSASTTPRSSSCRPRTSSSAARSRTCPASRSSSPAISTSATSSRTPIYCSRRTAWSCSRRTSASRSARRRAVKTTTYTTTEARCQNDHPRSLPGLHAGSLHLQVRHLGHEDRYQEGPRGAVRSPGDQGQGRQYRDHARQGPPQPSSNRLARPHRRLEEGHRHPRGRPEDRRPLRERLREKMPIRKYKPTSPGRRFMSVAGFEEITTSEPEKTLLESLPTHAGRNNQGRITTRHQGGGYRKLYRKIDFKRDKHGIEGKVATIEYDPNRSARIALVHYKDGEKRYILAPL